MKEDSSWGGVSLVRMDKEGCFDTGRIRRNWNFKKTKVKTKAKSLSPE